MYTWFIRANYKDVITRFILTEYNAVCTHGLTKPNITRYVHMVCPRQISRGVYTWFVQDKYNAVCTHGLSKTNITRYVHMVHLR